MQNSGLELETLVNIQYALLLETSNLNRHEQVLCCRRLFTLILVLGGICNSTRSDGAECVR